MSIQLNHFLFLTVSGGCFIFDNEGGLSYQKSNYSIRKKNIVRYYQASPGAFSVTLNGEVKISISGFGQQQIAQEKIIYI